MVREKSVPKGYKNTEVGVMPEDWEATTFGDVLTGFNTGATPSRSKPQYYKGNIKWVTSGELNYNIINDTIEKISYEAMLDTNLSLQPIGTFLIAITGLEAEGTRGSCAILGVKATTNQSCMALHATDKITTKFLFHYYVYKGANLALKYCQGTKQQSYTGKLVRILPISLPPLLEQKAIAKVLSDVDELIASIEKLIDKKQKIKQGTMQLLLTGKKRLPGFTGEWEVKKLGEIADTKTGNKNNEDKVVDGEYPFFVRSQKVERIDTYSYEGEAILVPGEGGIGNIHHYINNRFDYHQRVYKISDFSYDICGKFVYYCMMQNFSNHAMKNSVKATVDSLRLPTFEKFEISCPSLPEQKAIAQILSDMDSEIETLEKKLDKYKRIKEGMMEKLLTGKVRLI